MGGWHSESEQLESVEIPLRTFLEHLDIDMRDVGAPRRYLLFSGEGRPHGGVRDLKAVFDCEADARAAFHELRADRRSPSSWAQLVLLDHRGSFKPVCWFEANSFSSGLADRSRAAGTRRRSRRARR